MSKLTQPVHVDGLTLPAGTEFEIVSEHRLHVRARVRLDDGRILTVRLPRSPLALAALTGGQRRP